MTAEKFLSCLIKAIQSGQEIPLDATFIVDVIVIQRPVGGGGKGHYRVINIATDRLRKKSILSIMLEETGLPIVRKAFHKGVANVYEIHDHLFAMMPTKEMVSAIRSDVDILRRCCLEFRTQFLDITGVDPFSNVTIASACMAAYRSKHIQEKTIAGAMVPVNRYLNKRCYSCDCIRWLEYVSSKEGIQIRHSLNGFGEQVIDGKSVYGFCVETNTIYQYQDTSTNIFLAAFTACYPRLKLYSELERLGRAAIYFDTDSIIYQTDGQNDPPTGNFLGDFTDELDGRIITSFVSRGPKNYAYNLNDGTSNCKSKGFCRNFKNSLLLNYETVKEFVCSLDKTAVKSIVNPRKITVEKKKRRVINEEETRKYRLVYDKRVIQSDFSTLPYGF
ncbi:hypothetical protein AVEN_57721-1 [Araneus ventricosus]|uniref:DNA-directed DNA polymerase n=1 Tax=Araneus ventricosus TaxID=182803 RepID=A0A4Y2R7J2_ARAVE|nr:hypothetical protein AVEN_57721-1 [Araneus ventricosus]